MQPENVRRKIFENEMWYPESNGCFPIALAGAFAFQFPEMSVESTVKIVKELLRPVQKGEALESRKGEPMFMNPYDFIKGVDYWTHLVYYGFGEELRTDVNNRLKKQGIKLQMNFLPRSESVEAIDKLQNGASLIPTFAIYNNGKFDSFHSICFSKSESKIFAVDVNYPLTEFDLDNVKSFLTDINYTEPYGDVLTHKIGGTNTPIIYFEII